MDQEIKNVTDFNNISKRILTIIVLAPLIFFCIYKNNYWTITLLVSLSFFLAKEWYELTQKKIFFKEKNIFLFLILINLIISILVSFNLSVLITIFISLYYSLQRQWLFYGFIYICLPIIIFFHIENMINGSLILMFFLINIWSTDTFSYIFGKLFKGPKIFPSISPSKTYIGTFSGIFFGSLIGSFLFFQYLDKQEVIKIYIFNVLIALSALVGDLLVSKIKRIYKVKDASNYLPGHGGFLDRYDSVSFGLVVLFFLVYFL